MAAASSALASVIRASNENSSHYDSSYSNGCDSQPSPPLLTSLEGNADADEENCTVSAEV